MKQINFNSSNINLNINNQLLFLLLREEHRYQPQCHTDMHLDSTHSTKHLINQHQSCPHLSPGRVLSLHLVRHRLNHRVRSQLHPRVNCSMAPHLVCPTTMLTLITETRITEILISMANLRYRILTTIKRETTSLQDHMVLTRTHLVCNTRCTNREDHFQMHLERILICQCSSNNNSNNNNNIPLWAHRARE